MPLLDGLRGHAVFLGEPEERLAFFDLVPHVVRRGLDDVPLEEQIVRAPPGFLGEGVVEANVDVGRVAFRVSDDRRKAVGAFEDLIDPIAILAAPQRIFAYEPLNRPIPPPCGADEMTRSGASNCHTSTGRSVPSSLRTRSSGDLDVPAKLAFCPHGPSLCRRREHGRREGEVVVRLRRDGTGMGPRLATARSRLG